MSNRQDIIEALETLFANMLKIKERLDVMKRPGSRWSPAEVKEFSRRNTTLLVRLRYENMPQEFVDRFRKELRPADLAYPARSSNRKRNRRAKRTMY